MSTAGDVSENIGCSVGLICFFLFMAFLVKSCVDSERQIDCIKLTSPGYEYRDGNCIKVKDGK
jgi:hypothetical protein